MLRYSINDILSKNLLDGSTKYGTKTGLVQQVESLETPTGLIFASIIVENQRHMVSIPVDKNDFFPTV